MIDKEELNDIRKNMEEGVWNWSSLNPIVFKLLKHVTDLEKKIEEVEECMEVRLFAARTSGPEEERLLATACWKMALYDVRRIFDLKQKDF